MASIEIARRDLEHALETHGQRRIMVADGHDHASSVSAVRRAASKEQLAIWATPSGRVIEEGGRYELESRCVLRSVRYDGTLTVLRFMRREYVVSERLPDE